MPVGGGGVRVRISVSDWVVPRQSQPWEEASRLDKQGPSGRRSSLGGAAIPMVP